MADRVFLAAGRGRPQLPARPEPAGLSNGTQITAEFVTDVYHRLFGTEKAFRMSKHDLQTRPIYHRKRDSTEAHLTIVFAALAVSH